MTITSLYANNAEKPGKPIFNSFISPVGKMVHAYHDKPQLQTDEKTQKPILDDDGIQKAEYKVTIMWPKAALSTELIPMRTLAATTRDQAWGLDAHLDPWFRLEPFLRDGDNPEHNTKRRDYLMGHVYLNFKQKAIPTRHGDGRVTYSGGPQIIGPYNEDLLPVDVYAGCTARVSGIMFGTEYTGRKFISTRLNNIQKAADGERMGGGGRPDAKTQFDPLQTAPGAAGGFGNTVL